MRFLYRLVERAHHQWNVLKRLNVRVLIGCAAIIVSHWIDDPVTRARIRDAATALVIYSLTTWLQGQGKKRTDPETGRPLRNPTIRFKLPDDDGKH